MKSDVPRVLRHDARIEAMLCFGARVEILDKNLFMPRKADEVGEQPVELLFRHLLGVVPPDRAFSFRVANDVFVLGRTARVLTCLDDDRAACRELPSPRRTMHSISSASSTLRRIFCEASVGNSCWSFGISAL